MHSAQLLHASSVRLAMQVWVDRSCPQSTPRQVEVRLTKSKGFLSSHYNITKNPTRFDRLTATLSISGVW